MLYSEQIEIIEILLITFFFFFLHEPIHILTSKVSYSNPKLLENVNCSVAITERPSENSKFEGLKLLFLTRQ